MWHVVFSFLIKIQTNLITLIFQAINEKFSYQLEHVSKYYKRPQLMILPKRWKWNWNALDSQVIIFQLRLCISANTFRMNKYNTC